MKFLTFLVFYIILHVDYNYAKLCSRRVPLHKTRNVLRTSVRLVTTRNWIGIIKTQLQPYTYYDTEYFLSYEVEVDCCFGYTKINDKCEPLCPSGCPLNAYCDQPYRCSCKAGYSWAYNRYDKEACGPICENGCPAHSKCVAPNTCECEANYKYDPTNGQCQPLCAMNCPENAFCAEPNTCKCREGYDLKAFSSGDIACEPICKSGCQIWAHCVAPNECACVTGYEMINGNCEPKCEPACGANSHCLQPNNCICNSGYEFKLVEHKCVPICSIGCPAYSYCVQPERCACDAGYKMNENATQCLPVCEAGCPAHSVCYKPGECLCDEGFRPKQLADANGTMECEVICPTNCEPYGRCDDSGACQCHPGYVLDTEASKSEHLCKPHCSQGCKNGFCFSPETCVCNAGYLMGPNSTCVPTCSLGCRNAECVEPEICACLPGHRFKNGSVSNCEPICEPPCVNGDCVAPDLCLCKDHFEPVSAQTNLCKPSCVPKVVNGDCMGPQNCSCLNGYDKSSVHSHECLPVCTDCEFGECISPEVCSCHAGFYEERNANGTTCLPIETTSEILIYNPSTPITETDDEQPGAACGGQCKCWQNADHEISFQIASCENLCEDNVDESCLNLDDCLCSLRNLHLNCFASEAKTYRCLMPFNVPATNASTSEHLSTLADTKEASFPWVITVCGVLSALLVLTLLFVVWHRYRSNRGSENLIIDFQN